MPVAQGLPGWRRLQGVLLVLALVAGCSGSDPLAGGPWPAELAGWDLLELRDGLLAPVPGSVVYALHTPLFSDHAGKFRTLKLPAGGQVVLDAQGKLQFPVGTLISKTFYYQRAGASLAAAVGMASPPAGLDLSRVQLLETRILARGETGWQGASYVWDQQQARLVSAAVANAKLARIGALIPVQLAAAGAAAGAATAGKEFPYLVPDSNQCAGCHTLDHNSGAMAPIGPTLANLSQGLEQMQALAWLPGELPAAMAALPAYARWDDADASLDARARAYLDVNCGHCHRAGGAADTSGLFLDARVTDPVHLGRCKPPVAAGRGSGGLRVAIAPGAAEQSILVHRMASADPGVMMPELGRALVHQAGVALVGNWINAMPGHCG